MNNEDLTSAPSGSEATPNSQSSSTPASPVPPITSPAPAVPVAPATSPAVIATPTTPAVLDQRDQIFAALNYVSFLFIIPLIARRKDAEVMFNAKQGMVLFAAEVVVWFILSVLEYLLAGKLSGLGAVIFYGIAVIIGLVLLLLSLMGIYYVLQGKHWLMPIIGKISQKLQF